MLAVPTSRTAMLAWSIILLLAIAYHTFAPDDDPHRCRRVLETGRWIDAADENGDRMPFARWQPDGCMLHHYSSPDVRQCLNGRRVVFVGDSQNRQTAYALARLLERAEADWDEHHIDNHHSFNLTYHGIQIQNHWNPYLQIADEPDKDEFNLVDKVDDFRKQLELLRFDRDHKKQSIETQKGAALVVFGAGAWHTNPERSLLDEFPGVLANLSELLPSRDDFFTRPLDPIDGIGNQVIFAPPFGPWYNGSEKSKKKEKLEWVDRVKDAQRILKESAGELNFHELWANPLLTEGQNLTVVDPKSTGFHVISSVAEARAQILLNLRCNARLDNLRGYPNTRTCCTDYGRKPVVQLAIVFASILHLVACIAGEAMDLRAKREKPRWPLLSMNVAPFTVAVLMCYYADRTHMMAKGTKLWSYADFFLLCAPCFILTFATIRKSPQPRTKPGLPVIEKDQPFLSRDQTEEWKGWMQFLILIYHWTNAAQSTAIYIMIRLLVASYLFQTGYNHTTFFLLKKDFSIRRVISVLLRLNLLSCALAYTMNTDYMLYYFSPLVTFWYLVVYATMAIGHKRLNDDIQLVIAKICVACVAVTLLMVTTPANRWLFAVLRTVFKIRWSVSEWEFRVTMDPLIVFIGMLAAIVNLRIKEDIRAPLRYCMALLGVVIIAWYMQACVTKLASATSYRLWHPFTSFAPILAFIAIRNMSATVRNYHSTAMAWLGKCSLETYTLQFHLFLAADTRGVLLIDAFRGGDGSILGDRWTSLLIVVPMFLWLSSTTAQATGTLVQIILGPSPAPRQPGEGTFIALASDDEDDAVDNDKMHLYDPQASIVARLRDAVGKGIQKALMGIRSARLPSVGVLSESLVARVIVALVVMWILNLFSPLPSTAPIYDGYTPHRANNGSSIGLAPPPGSTPTPVVT